MLSNFDIWTAAGGIDKAIVRSFPVTVTDGVMTIDFIRRIENAKISAIEIIPVDTVAPAAVTGLSATAAATGVNLGWSASSASDLAGYNVYRSSSATGTYTKLNAALLTALTYADTTAPQGVPAYYQVTAVDTSNNESVRSTTASATRPDTTPPAGLTGITAAGSATGITVGWTASPATDLAGYNVYRSTTAGGAYVKVNTAIVTGTSYSDTTAPAGATSYYQVTAVDQSGNESAKSASGNAFRPDTTAPGKLPTVTAAGSGTGITISWTASTATDVAGYNVYRSATAAGTFTKVNATLLTSVVTYVDTAAPQGVASFYQVTAVDTSNNESERSDTATATRPDTTAPGVLGGVTASASATAITVGWTASSAADLDGYTVYRAASATGVYTKLNTTLVTGTSFVDSAAPVGATSYYQVTATDLAGNESVRSATASALRADSTPPAQLTGVTATASAAAITLGWSGSTAADLGRLQRVPLDLGDGDVHEAELVTADRGFLRGLSRTAPEWPPSTR